MSFVGLKLISGSKEGKPQNAELARDATEGFVKWLSAILEERGMPAPVAFELADLEADQERDIDGKPTMVEIFTAGAVWGIQHAQKKHEPRGEPHPEAAVEGEKLPVAELDKLAFTLDLLMSLQIGHRGEKAMFSASSVHERAAKVADALSESINASPLGYGKEKGDDPRATVQAYMLDICQKHRFNVVSMNAREAYRVLRRSRVLLADFLKKHGQPN